MDTLGPRIMVNVGTQAVSNTGLNPRDLAPLTNDAFLATFTGKAPLSASNGISRQNNNNNNYRQSYTTQMERVTLRSKARPTTGNGESMEPDSAILSIIRGNGSDNNQQQQPSQRQMPGTRNRRRSFNQQLLGGWDDIPCSPNYRPTNEGNNRRRRTRSGGAQQQISVVDQMAAQPHIPYAILPKRFEPKQVAGNGLQQQSRSANNNNNNVAGGSRRRRPAAPRRSQRQQEFYDDQWDDEEDDDLWLEPMPPMMMMNRRMPRRPNRGFNPPAGYYGPRQRLDDYYDAYAYGPMPRPGPMPIRSRRRMTYPDDGYIPFDIVPSYDLNEWQGPYARPRQSLYSQQQRNGARFGNGFIRDDHRVNGSSRQSRNGNKPLTPTRNGKQSKSPRNAKGQQKRRTSRQRKQRNQNSKTEGTPLTNANDNEQSNDEKPKQETNDTDSKPLPPRDQENKENNGEQKSE